ncbi:redoxin domain-containing protein [Psychroserpens sp. XS_ASV72]|uniref:redoxin domain-containing protein n=1 Tax=Psychroserpens sp. XS_ASV72 TaxID=3241293 RepID=UPI0035181DA4
MRHIISFLVFTVLLTSCNTDKKTEVKQDGYRIEGSAPGVYNGIRVYLETRANRGRTVALDTAIVMNESFVFEGKVESPIMVYLNVNSVRGSKPLILENKSMTAVIDKDQITNSTIEGTEANTAFKSYTEKIDELSRERLKLNGQLRASQNNSDDDPKPTEAQSEMDKINKAFEDLPFEYIEKNKDNVFSVILLQNLIEGKSPNISRIESAFNSLNEDLKNSAAASIFKTKLQVKKVEIEALNATQIGKVAPNFSAPTPEGKTLSLNEVKGKLTLIDFWASWCKPCRRENPNVVKVYNKYHDKGLEIISVSLDGTRTQREPKQAWIKAIEDDKLTWSHVSNLNYFDDPVAKMYNITSIPATFLLDENGTIVAKNLRGDALEQKVAEYLN